MRTIIAGSRDVSLGSVRAAMAACPWSDGITLVLSGGARGADMNGEEWAREHHIPIEQYLAEWNRYGKGAGMRRNVEMAAMCEALVAVWDLVSPGTRFMIEMAEKYNRRIFVWSPAFGEMRRDGRGWLPLAPKEPEGA